MAQAEIHEVLSVSKEQLWDTIVRYEDYPKFVDGCTQVKVERKSAGHARVTYHISMMKDVVYTIDHKEDQDKGVVEWSLVESDAFKKNSGRWQIAEAGTGKTDVQYRLELEFKIPVPGFILNGLIKKQLPSMVKSFEKQARKASKKA
jgi:ribosome-associated toxin RatA of RatAB toxin-antitoxin module